MKNVFKIAKSKNIKLDEKTIFQQRKFLTLKNSNWNSSMRRDMENGSKIEHDHIFFELIKIANRNTNLKMCDWTQAADSPLSDTKKAEWATYRQALRDITDSATSLDDVTWPEKPE